MVWGREWQTHYFSGIGKLSQTISVISNGTFGAPLNMAI
jgi:hypothetical protein